MLFEILEGEGHDFFSENEHEIRCLCVIVEFG